LSHLIRILTAQPKLNICRCFVIGPDDDAGLRVMGDYQTTRYIKGAIVPTVDAIET